MTDDTPVDLGFIARQLRQMMSDIGSLRDDVNVLTAIAMRQDGTLSAMLTEIRAMHSQQSRVANRVRELEQPRP
jgi:hypothetical protein